MSQFDSIFDDLPEEETEPNRLEQGFVPPEPVSPAPPPSAGSGVDPSIQEPPKQGIDSPTNYLGETWKELGIKLPDNLRDDLGGEDSVIPTAEVEKGMVAPTPFTEGQWGHAGKQAFDMVAMRDTVAEARSGAWTRQFIADNGRMPTKEESNKKYIEFARQANDELYALADKVRGARASALPGSQGIDRRFVWLNTDPRGKLYSGAEFGPVRISAAKQEERDLLSKVLAPFVVSMAGAEAEVLVEDVDDKGKIQEKLIKQPYNESHFLGFLDWMGRQSLFSYAATAAVAGSSEDEDSWAAGKGTPLALINPVNYYRGWGSDKHLNLLSRGEDIVSLSDELATRKLIGAQWLLDGAEAVGLVSPETNKTAQNLTDFLSAFGLAMIDPDVLSLMTFGTGKVAKLQKVQKIGDFLGISTKAKATRRAEMAGQAGRELAELAVSGEEDSVDLASRMDEILRSVDVEQKEVALNIARAIVASDPKASRLTETLKQRQFNNKSLERGKESGEVKLAGVEGRRQALEDVGRLTAKLEKGETPTLRAAEKAKQEAIQAGDVQRAKKIDYDMKSYKAAQIEDMWAASILSDLKTQKRVITNLRNITRASRVTTDIVSKDELKKVAQAVYESRKEMQEAFLETPKPRGTGKYDPSKQTLKYKNAKKKYDTAVAAFSELALRASTNVADDAEKVLDELISRAAAMKKFTAKKVSRVSNGINKAGTFKVDPKRHQVLVSTIVHKAPKALEERALLSALSVAFKEQEAAYNKLSKFIAETPEAREVVSFTGTGGISKAIDVYRKAAGEEGEDVARAMLNRVSRPKRRLKYDSIESTGIKIGGDEVSGIDFDRIEDYLKSMGEPHADPALDGMPTQKAVARWLTSAAVRPEYRVIAKKLLDSLPDKDGRIVIVTPKWIDKYGEDFQKTKKWFDQTRGAAVWGKEVYGEFPIPKSSEHIFINGLFDGGLNAETLLHELIHRATMDQIATIATMSTAQRKSSRIGKEYRRLQRIAKSAIDNYIEYSSSLTMSGRKLVEEGSDEFKASMLSTYPSLKKEYDEAIETIRTLEREYPEEMEHLYMLLMSTIMGASKYSKQPISVYNMLRRTGSSIPDHYLSRGIEGFVDLHLDPNFHPFNDYFLSANELLLLALDEIDRSVGIAQNLEGLRSVIRSLESKFRVGLLDEYSFREANVSLEEMRKMKGLSKIEAGEAKIKEATEVLSTMALIDPRTALAGKTGYADLYELVSYGMTNRPVMEFLKKVNMPKEKKSLWSNFVAALANILNLPTKYKSALSELIMATENIMATKVEDLYKIAPELRKSVKETNRLPMMEKLGAYERGKREYLAAKAKLTRGSYYFSDEALKNAVELTEGNSRYVIVYMSPDEFLNLAEEGIEPGKAKRIEEALSPKWWAGSPKKLDSIPSLGIRDSGKVYQHEGRHRMRALKARGVQKVPVLLESDNVRWSSQLSKDSNDYVDKLPKKLIAQEGAKNEKYSMDLPIHREGPNRGRVKAEYRTDVPDPSPLLMASRPGGPGDIRTLQDFSSVPVDEAARRAEDMYMIEQVELLTGWLGKGNKEGALARSINWLATGVENFWNPAQKALGPASDEMHQIGISTMSAIKKMQEDIVRHLSPAVKKAGDAAEEAAKAAGKDRNAIRAARVEAETEVIKSFITSPESINGSIMNTIFEGRAPWEMAKPMLKATAGKDISESDMAFNSLYKMWLPPGTSVNAQILGSLYKTAKNLLTYGQPKKPNLKNLKEGELEKLRQAGDNISFEDFSQAMKTATESLYTGAKGSDPNSVRVNYFASQAVMQMALMNLASTRMSKILADFPQDGIDAAVRLASGDSLRPEQDMVMAAEVLNRLKVPTKLRQIGNKANKQLEVGLRLYSDGNGANVIVPYQWMKKTSELLSNIEKTAEAVSGKVLDPWEQQSINTYRGIYRLWHSAILTGLFIPRAAYFTNIYVGNLGQILARQGFLAAATYAKESAKDILIWAPQKLARQTPMGKYVDAFVDRMDAKLGNEFHLSTPTNAILNRHISMIMDPSLADNATKITGKAGKQYTMGEVRRLAVEQGIFTSFVSGSGLSNIMSRTNPGFGSTLWEKITEGGPLATRYKDFADTLEQRQRVGLFSDLVVNKGLTPEEAGRITRDALYDWDSPMTSFETWFAKNVFMFYNFTRRAMGQGMRILLDPYLNSKTDTAGEGFLRSSPFLAMLTGKPAYQTANVMAMERTRRELSEYMTDEETAAEYPWWAKKAHNKMFLPNSPMGQERSASYTQTLGRDVNYKVTTVPSITPMEMINQWADMVRILGAYGVAWAVDTPAHIITGAPPSQVNFKEDVLIPMLGKAAEQAGPIGEGAIQGIMDAMLKDKQTYLSEGANVTRLSDRVILEWMEQYGPFMSGIVWEDANNPGMMRTTPSMLALVRAIPAISNEINSAIGPYLDVSAEGGSVGEALMETLTSYLGFKTYRYSPQQVREWDQKAIRDKMNAIVREENRKMPINTTKPEITPAQKSNLIQENESEFGSIFDDL